MNRSPLAALSAALLATLLLSLSAPTAVAAPPYGLSAEDAAWLKQAAADQLAGSRVEGVGGVWIQTPDGEGHYGALWTRDFYYMVQYGGDLMDPAEIKAATTYLLDRQRADGCIPDRVNAKGEAIYSPGAPGNPLADHAMDNGPFMALAACSYVEQSGDQAFFRAVEPRLRKGLEHVRRAENGLVYNDPADPQCVYGFTDVIKKTGHLLFCSLLYADACERMAALSEAAGCGAPGAYREQATMIRDRLAMLWNDEAGMFWAADGDCRQIDVWGSALAVEQGMTTAEQARRVAEYLVANQDKIFLRGQVRHLPTTDPEWESLFRPCPAGTYQNGAYWATPLAWVVPVVARADEQAAAAIVGEVVQDFRANGINECINVDYLKLPDLVVSATNVYSLTRNDSGRRSE